MINAAAKRTLSTSALSRTLPFALFMAFIAVGEGVQLAQARGWLVLPATTLHYLYPVKTVAVAALLLVFTHDCTEFCWKDWLAVRTTAAVCVVGVATCVIWVWLDYSFSVTGTPNAFNPMLFADGAERVVMTSFRVAGAVLVVPLMEELFWRSFLIRYLVAPDFDAVPIGQFTWPSFLITVILFGLEHHLIVAGIAAGVIYNLILYRTKSLAQCVLAHAVTNLTLAGYVLYTGKWYFW